MSYFSSWDGHMMISTLFIIQYIVGTSILNILAMPLILWILGREDQQVHQWHDAVLTDHEDLPVSGYETSEMQRKETWARPIVSGIAIVLFMALLLNGVYHRY